MKEKDSNAAAEFRRKKRKKPVCLTLVGPVRLNRPVPEPVQLVLPWSTPLWAQTALLLAVLVLPMLIAPPVLLITLVRWLIFFFFQKSSKKFPNNFP
jgi:hypothetical protein